MALMLTSTSLNRGDSLPPLLRRGLDRSRQEGRDYLALVIVSEVRKLDVVDKAVMGRDQRA